MDAVPDDFARRIIELHDAAGVDWLRRLPSMIDDCEKRWSLTTMPPIEPLSYNYVAPAIRTNSIDVIVKLGVPNFELRTEIEALRLFDGHGVVKLLDADPDQGILLLERLNPGLPLASLADDEAATSIAIQVMRRLWQPAPSEHPFPSISDWSTGLQRLRDHFEGGTGPFPRNLIERAERLFEELIGSASDSVLLHGDLHHWNILAAERQPWLAIDPKGVVGEPAYEVGALLRNPYPQLLHEPAPERILSRRVDQLAEGLGFERSRIIGWGFAQAVLAGWWSYEDHKHGWEWWIACAEHMDGL